MHHSSLVSFTPRARALPSIVWPLVVLVVVSGGARLLPASDNSPAASPAPATAPAAGLRIVFSSYRARRQHPQLYRYDVGTSGEPQLAVAAPDKRSDHHPAAAALGQKIAFASEQEGQASRVFVSADAGATLLDLPGLNKNPNAQGAPALSTDGRLVVFEAWRSPQQPGGWDVLHYDLEHRKFIDLPGLNTPLDERAPTLSGDGQTLAFVTRRPDSGGADIVLYDLVRRAPIPTPGLNSPLMEADPSLSDDGRWLAFSSDREGGSGGRDIYLYDRVTADLEPLPGLNSEGQEQSAMVSGDGRLIAFVSEPLDGAGERDILLYDRVARQLIPLPGLNSERDDFDPCLVSLPALK